MSETEGLEYLAFTVQAEEKNDLSRIQSETNLSQPPSKVKDTAIKRTKSVPSLSSLEGLPHHSYVQRAKRSVSLYHKHRRNSSHPQDDDVIRNRAILESLQPPPKPLVSKSQKAMEKLRDSVCRQGESLPIKQFYLAVNQCFLYGHNITLCALCRQQKEKSDSPKSHIFPESLLDSYRKIHCEQEKGFIYDPATQRTKRAGTLVYPLFCKKCECDASNEENFLRDFYLQIMGPDESQKDKHPEILAFRSHKLRHILAIVLLRGILMAVNIWNEIMSYDNFFTVFLELREYCLETELKSYSKSPFAQKVHLFLFPNAHFNIQNEKPNYLFNFQLRNPQFTTVIKVGNSSCFYMKFDCFHCLVPLVPLVNNGDLGFLNTPGSCFADCNYLSEEDSFILLHHKEAMEIFPRVLLEYNQVEAGQLLDHFLGVSKYLTQPYCVIQSPKHQNPSSQNLCTPLSERLSRMEIREISSFRREIQRLQDNAREASPLKDATAIIKRELRKKTNELEKLKVLSERQVDVLELYRVKLENEHLHQEKEGLNQENEDLHQKNEVLRQEKDALLRELQQEKMEKEHLQQQNDHLKKLLDQQSTDSANAVSLLVSPAQSSDTK